MKRSSTIELFKEDMKFSAGHFTVFSETVRENLHGHNYTMYAALTTEIEGDGLSFDYRFYKEKLFSLCQQFDETVLLAGHCRHLQFEDHGAYWHVTFNHETMIFLKRDVIILPLNNITVEELSHWMLQEILADELELKKNKVTEVVVKIFSGPGQSGSSSWKKEEHTT